MAARDEEDPALAAATEAVADRLLCGEPADARALASEALRAARAAGPTRRGPGSGLQVATTVVWAVLMLAALVVAVVLLDT